MGAQGTAPLCTGVCGDDAELVTRSGEVDCARIVACKTASAIARARRPEVNALPTFRPCILLPPGASLRPLQLKVRRRGPSCEPIPPDRPFLAAPVLRTSPPPASHAHPRAPIQAARST